MSIPTSDSWDPRDLSHRYTVSFFKKEYGDDPKFIVASNDRRNDELNYFNIAASGNSTNAEICAGLLVSYMESQGIPYHDGKDRTGCFNDSKKHLAKADGKVLFTADIVDHYFRFLGEE